MSKILKSSKPIKFIDSIDALNAIINEDITNSTIIVDGELFTRKTTLTKSNSLLCHLVRQENKRDLCIIIITNELEKIDLRIQRDSKKIELI